MHLRIVHTTGYEYDDQVAASYNEARLTPLTQYGQLVTHSRVDVTPKPWTFSYRDHWGTQVTAFEVLDPHRSLTVVGTSDVHTAAPLPFRGGLAWEDLDGLADQFAEFLMILNRARPADELVALIAPMRELRTPADAVRAVCALIHTEVEYQPGWTEVESDAAHAWVLRKGVCQDFAHMAIGCLRTLGIPARYVSGYVYPTRDEAVIGQPVRGESHAWFEWWDGGWRGLDPTNEDEPGERHVVVATGRNYDDVRPLAGVYAGGGVDSHMFVSVEITRLP